MKILLTNDDGINSEGILRLASALRASGKHKVSVIAPDINRSGISHALSLFGGPVKLSLESEDTWSCSGFPVDCIIVGLKTATFEKPDLVLSGINMGENLGTDIIYSGTASAARQSSLLGIPAIALSLTGSENYHWNMAVSWTVDHLEELYAFYRKDSFVNVNIPNSPRGPQGFIAAWPAAKAYADTISAMDAPDGSHFFFFGAGENTSKFETGSDCDVVSRNFVSVSTVYNYPAVYRELCPGAPDYAAVAMRDGKKE